MPPSNRDLPTRGARVPSLLRLLTALMAMLLLVPTMREAAADNSVTYTYDPVGRVQSITDADGQTINYQYDANGNLVTQAVTTTGLGAVLAVTIQSTNNTETVELPAGPSPSLSQTSVLTATATNGTGQLSYSWGSKQGFAFTSTGAATSSVTLGSTCTLVAGCDDIGVYQVTVTDSASPAHTATATISVTHNYLPALTLSSPLANSFATTMAGSGSQSLSSGLNASVTGGQPPYTYSWAPTGAIPNSSTFSATGLQTSSPSFSSTCTNQDGCLYEYTYQLTATDQLGVQIKPSATVEHLFTPAALSLTIGETPATATQPGETGTFTPAPTGGVASFFEPGTISSNGEGQVIVLTSYVTVSDTSSSPGTPPYHVTWPNPLPAGFWIPNGSTLPGSTAFEFQSLCEPGTAGGCDYKATLQAVVTDSSYPTPRSGTVSVALDHQYKVGTATPPLGIQVYSILPGSSLTGSITNTQGGALGSEIYATITGGVSDSAGNYLSVKWNQLSGSQFTLGPGTQSDTNTTPPTTIYTLDVASACPAGTLLGCDYLGAFELAVIDGAGYTKQAVVNIEHKYPAPPLPVAELGPLAIVDPGFEAVTLAAGGTSGNSPGWVQNCSCSTYRPTSTQFANGPTEGVNVFAIARGSISQQLTATVQPNTTYTLQVDIGQRADYASSGYVSTLMAGTTTLATDNNTLAPALGGFVTSSVTYYASATDPNIGKPLIIVLAAGTGNKQTEFDNVHLTATAGSVVEMGPLAVVDPSFEAVALAAGGTAATAPGWTQSCGCVVFRPTAAQFPNGPTNGVNVMAVATGSLSQLLTAVVQPNTIYTLQVDVGQRADYPSSGYISTLMAGSTTLAADNNSLVPAPGSFVTSKVVYYASPTDPNIGQPLTIVLAVGTADKQTEFDNVRLTATAGPVLQSGTLGIVNPSFEAVKLSPSGTSSTVPGWTEACVCVTSSPKSTIFPHGLPDGINMLAVTSGSVLQQLEATIQPNTTYTLQVDVGQRPDETFTGYVSALVAGTKILAADNNTLLPVPGSFSLSSVSYYVSATDPNIGQPLAIALGAGVGGAKTVFDNVIVTAMPGDTLIPSTPAPGAPTWKPTLGLGTVLTWMPMAPISLTPAAGNNGLPLTYSVVSGLPEGVSFNPSTLQFTGTPVVAGNYSIVVQAADTKSSTQVTFSLAVSVPGTRVFVTAATVTGNIGGLAGAPITEAAAICANDKNNPQDGRTYIALLSDGSSNARMQFTLRHPVISAAPPYTIIATSNFLVPPGAGEQWQNPISSTVTEAWTGSDTYGDYNTNISGGSLYPGGSCGTWNTSVNPYVGGIGDPSSKSGAALSAGSSSCTASLPLICVSQSP